MSIPHAPHPNAVRITETATRALMLAVNGDMAAAGAMLERSCPTVDECFACICAWAHLVDVAGYTFAVVDNGQPLDTARTAVALIRAINDGMVDETGDRMAGLSGALDLFLLCDPEEMGAVAMFVLRMTAEAAVGCHDRRHG